VLEKTLLTELIASVLDIEPELLTEDSGRETLEVWDSLAHLNIVSAVEETFDVVFSTSEMRELTSVGRLRDALASRNIAV
jgi:acyl carrier protein